MSWITCLNQNLLDHIYQSEGHYNFLYADSRNIPTISAGVALFSSTQAVSFHEHYPLHLHENELLGRTATPFEVTEEWFEVRKAGRIPHFSSDAGQAEGMRIAHLRLTEQDARQGICFKTTPFIRTMSHRVAPWGENLPEGIQIAIVDAAIQPVDHNPFHLPRPTGHDPLPLAIQQKAEMWTALHRSLTETTPEQRRQAAQRALELFSQIWANTSYLDEHNPNYAARQARRIEHFRRGVEIIARQSP